MTRSPLPLAGETEPDIPLYTGDIDADAWVLLRGGLAERITGGLSYPSKMDCPAWGISATRCRIGSILARQENTVCAGCDAMKGTFRATNVADKLVLLNDARDTQTAGFGTNDFSASMIEDQRLVLANLLDDDLCDLRKKYRNNIKMVENYFDLAELRKPSSDSDAQFAFNGAVEAGMTSAVPVPDRLVLSANAACVFSNKSNLTDLQFFFSANASAADNPVKTTVSPMETVQATAAESGWAPGAKFVIVKNTGTVTAEFELFVTEAVV